MLNNVLNILFPEICPLCEGRSDSHCTAPLCSSCWESISPYEGPRCQKCARPLISDASLTCGECAKKEPAFTSAASYGLYEGALKKAINLLKYYGIKRLAKPLAEFVTERGVPEVDAVVPVPLHLNRLKQREYNHSALIAHIIAKRGRSRLLLDCLIKTEDTAPQVGLSLKERVKNIRNAFEVSSNSVTGKDILLFDDVYTTGATVRECSRVLKKAGAEKIFVMALAHGTQD